jgi:hypothetical protein
MKAKTHALDYYRRTLAAQDHPMKRLNEHAKIMLFARSQEIPVNSESAAHWYYVSSGAVRRSAIRSDGRRQILDLMLPGDFFFVVNRHDHLTVEAIAENTALASGAARYGVRPRAPRCRVPGPVADSAPIANCRWRNGRRKGGERFGELTHAQALHHGRAVNLDRAHAEAELMSDHLVRAPVNQPLEDFAFVWAKGVDLTLGIGHLFGANGCASAREAGLDCSQQCFLAVWFLQEVDRAHFHGADRDLDISLGRHDDDR